MISHVLRRAGAFLVDIIILFVILAPAGFLTQWLLGYQSQTGPAIWRTILLNFSLPSWLYFILSDRSSRGASLGKRLLRLRVTDISGGQPGWGQAVGRTAVKLLPWELAHFSAFALSSDLSQFNLWQSMGLAASNGLALLYLIVAVATRGRRSVHDVAAGTEVRPI